MSFYAVRVGRVPGIYTTWTECAKQTIKYPKAAYKKFPTEKLAWDFINEKKTEPEAKSSTINSGYHKSAGQEFIPLGTLQNEKCKKSLSTIRLKRNVSLQDGIKMPRVTFPTSDSSNDLEIIHISDGESKMKDDIIICSDDDDDSERWLRFSTLKKKKTLAAAATNLSDVSLISTSLAVPMKLPVFTVNNNNATTQILSASNNYKGPNAVSMPPQKFLLCDSDKRTKSNFNDEDDLMIIEPEETGTIACPTCHRPGYKPTGAGNVRKKKKPKRNALNKPQDIHRRGRISPIKNRIAKNKYKPKKCLSKERQDHLRMCKVEGELARLINIVDMKDAVHVYTDGACSNNGKKGARAGIGVWWGDDDPLNVSQRISGVQTNNRAEIQAAVKALEIAKIMGEKKIVLYTDSEFLIKGVTEWMDGWKKRNWTLSGGGQVKNKTDFQALEKAKEGIAVKWVHVKGHCGIRGNEMADKLATESLKENN